MKSDSPIWSVALLRFRQAGDQFIVGGNSSFLKTPVAHSNQIHALFLLATNEQSLIEVGARFPVDVACKTILHAIRR